MPRNTTWVVDIDGVILFHHCGGSSKQWSPTTAKLLPHAIQFFDAVEKRGDCVVLLTARPESLRTETEETLRLLGVYWHTLVMGVTSGPRVIVNDGEARAITLERNEGLGCLLGSS